MDLDKLNSIHQFFTLIGCDFQCYDLGRNIRKVDKQELIEFEQTQLACKTPFLQHLWLAVLFWPDTTEHRQKPPSHYVWFLKLPLDEQARLNLAARDDFLHRLYDALKQYLEAGENSDKNSDNRHLHSLEAAMKNNPYGFQPKPEQMANFHALAQKHLQLPPSRYYYPTQTWFSGQNQFSDWGELGFQGLADFAARLDETCQVQNSVTDISGTKTNEQLLIAALTQIPRPPFIALGNCLENYPISATLTRAIYQRANHELIHNSDPLSLALFCAAAIRATSQSQLAHQPALFIQQILQSPVSRNIEILAAISGRCWNTLKQYEVLMPYLEALARTEHGQGAFNAIMADLMFIPGMRDAILHTFRSPERSNSLSQAIGDFFSSLHKNTGQL